MSWRMVRTIFRKDLRDAIRDARVLVALLVPLGIGVFYNLTFDDDDTRPAATVAYAAADDTGLPEAIRAVVGETVRLRFVRVATEAAVRALVDDAEADVGFATPAGFDAALRGGERPALTLVTAASPSFAGGYVAAALEPALRRLAGQGAPAAVRVEARPAGEGEESVVERLGLRTWSVTVALVMMIAMIAMLAVPVILAEEAEKKTLEALVLVASYLDVVAAKALVGVAYVAIMVPLLLGITRLAPDNVPLFAAAVALTAVTLLGFGLLLGGLFRNANQLNTWSGVLLVPVIAPAFAVGLPTPEVVQTVLGAFPTGPATKLIINGMSGEAIFAEAGRSFLILVAWGVAAYGLLLWDLQRRQG